MAKLKRASGSGAVAPAPADAGKGKAGTGINHAVGQDRSGPVAAKTQSSGKDFSAAKAKLIALDLPDNPVCAVYWPEAVGDLWSGTYGNAPIHKGDALAVTSDGKRHAL